MLLLTAKLPPVSERGVYSVYFACLSRTFINVCVSFFLILVFSVECGIGLWCQKNDV